MSAQGTLADEIEKLLWGSLDLNGHTTTGVRKVAERITALRTRPGMERAAEWRPIETAPKDGAIIDVWVPGATGGYRVADLKFDGFGQLCKNGCVKDLARWPTHWRPLPEPPAAIRREAGQ